MQSSTDAQVREMVHQRRRRRRTLLVSLAAVVTVLGAALIGAGLVRATDTEPGEAPEEVPAGVAADRAGLVTSEGPVRVDLYLDYLCPECRITEKALAPELEKMRERGEVRVVHRPVAFLDDRSAPAGYSTRAASAAACAADQDTFEPYTAALFDEQPPEQGPGLDTDRLVALGRDVGITGASFERCVRDGTYRPWVTYVSDVAASRGVALTPTVKVDGKRVEVSGPDRVEAFVRAVEESRS